MDVLRNHPSLHGLWLGSKASQIPTLQIQDGDGYHGYCIEDSKVGRRRAPNEAFEQMSDKQQRIQAVLETGGMLRMKVSGLTIVLQKEEEEVVGKEEAVVTPTVDRLIEKLIVAQPLVSTIYPWKKEQDMRQGLGQKVYFSEKKAFSNKFHYQMDSQNVSVHWSLDHPTTKLDRIIVGGAAHEEPCFTARDLLVEFVQAWDALEKHDFQEPPMSDQPTLIRYQRLQALVSALGLPNNDLRAIATGSFLDDDPTGNKRTSDGAMEQLRSVLPDYSTRTTEPPSVCLRTSRQIYRNLLHYRHEAEKLLSHNEGWLEVGRDLNTVAMIQQTETVNKALKEKLEPIEQVLARMLDTQEPLRSFCQSWLVETYGFNVIVPKEFDQAWAWGFGYDIEWDDIL